jgi:hypothetical protein
MFSGSGISLLLSVLVGFLLGIVTWGFLRVRWQEAHNARAQPGDGVLLSLIALAAFALGVFLTYALLGLGLQG